VLPAAEATFPGRNGLIAFSSAVRNRGGIVHWSPPKPFLRTEFGDTYECGDAGPTAYASFIDPSSPARNFDVTGKSGWLYYTQFNPPDCNTWGTYDRDLVRIPIELTIEPAG
jgi:hypothetical protein